MIVFVGDQTKGYFIEDVGKKHKMNVEYVPEELHIENQVNHILTQSGCKYIVYDIEQYVDNAEVVAEEIKRISKANNSKVIILAKGFLPQSEMILRLYEKEIYNIIFAIELAEQKDQLEKCMNGYYDANPIELLSVTKEAIQLEKKNQVEFKRIGVAGSCSRIGTTTQAIQIVKYLNLKGYKACYMEMNDKKYVEQLAYYFETQENDEEIGKVTYENVDMYYKQEKISDVLRLGYDYYVYDFGVYTDTAFNKTSFLEKDIRIFVVGAKGDEMQHTTGIIESCFYDSVYYIYNFTPEADQESIRELMEEKATDTFFSVYTPDPFVYSNAAIYSKMIPVDERSLPEVKKKWWKRK